MMYLKHVGRFTPKQKRSRLSWLPSRTIGEIGPIEDEDTSISSRKVFGPALPYGVRDDKDAKMVVKALAAGERKLIFDALRKKMADQYLEHKRLGNATIHPDDLVKIWYVTFIPTFVFGALDSSLLIYSGQSINSTFAAIYGLSVMGAAALGNVLTKFVLHLVQIRFGHVIERFGLRFPVLSPEQMHNKDVSRVSNWATSLGLLMGSIIGLFPLLFYDYLTEEEVERKKKILLSKYRRNDEAEMIDHHHHIRSFSEEVIRDYGGSERERKKKEEERRRAETGKDGSMEERKKKEEEKRRLDTGKKGSEGEGKKNEEKKRRTEPEKEEHLRQREIYVEPDGG
ncbi:hypothetical protein KIN20_003824 [Parelaphostrongylus tenuis]|uniref:Transmembrane protein 65 n=1 Tax=Parelaphostrongylus tenuis TaxID=148309 RepID=A0AAD5MQG8_PARTN|nr:hypothetical protein KIN20_003824 [Parelaphostrongylus tenuis]